METFSVKKNICWIWRMCLRRNHSKNQFCLMCSETNPNLKLKVLDAVLKVRKIHISSNAYFGITSVLKENTAKYPIRRVIIKNYSISVGSMSSSVDHVFRDGILQRVVVGIEENDVCNGAFRKNPFNFITTR